MLLPIQSSVDFQLCEEPQRHLMEKIIHYSPSQYFLTELMVKWGKQFDILQQGHLLRNKRSNCVS